ncbi:MAG: hypothetical protein HYV63_12605 [Candidatus Schekmanbacteria bacterium]|nr:hypothetical protein [Candidatus Schekmanbacteria bacterium]
MPYHLRASLKLEDQEEYCSAVVAGLEALVELPAAGEPWEVAPAIEPWTRQRQELRAERDARDEARFQRARKGAAVHVADTVHDAASKHFAGVVLLASGRSTSESPYRDLYGTAAAGEVNRLGADREVTASRVIVEKARALGNPAIGEALAAYAAATERLERAAAEREGAEVALRPFEIRRVEMVEKIERLIEKTEARLRSSFPGNTALVRAVLGPDGGRKRAANTAAEAEPPTDAGA